MSKTHKKCILMASNGITYLSKTTTREEANTQAKEYARRGVVVDIYEKLTTWTPDRVQALDREIKGVDA